MSWQGIEGHDAIVEKFRRTLRRGRLASTYLFVGPAGVGKRLFARRLAQTLLCSSVSSEEMAPCGQCPACQQVLAGTHPDLEWVSLPPDKKFIPVEVFIGDREHRMREGFCHNLAMKPFMGGRKIGVIEAADFLNEEGANCLLKTLEEPPPKSVLILIGTSADKQLPTIRSRCQVVRFDGLPPDVVANLLVQHEITADRAEAERLAGVSEGGLARAVELADPRLWEFRSDFLSRLAEPVPDTIRLVRAVTAFIDETAKDVPQKRAQLRHVIEMALEFYRENLLESVSNRDGGHEAPMRRVEVCLDSMLNLDRNANVNMLIEFWLDEMARVAAAA